MIVDPESLGRLDPACRMSVVIPAKNEEATIGLALDALLHQRGPDGWRVDPRTYEILIFANNCTDGTAAIARWFAKRPRAPQIHVIEKTLAAPDAHVGIARRALLDVASERYLRAARPDGIVASTDADSHVGRQWIASTMKPWKPSTRWAGNVEVATEERDRMLAPMRLLYDRERTYRRLLGEVEHREDPQRCDPWPRHDAFVGASFAVTAHTYRAAGGLQAKPRLEDQAFAQQLARIDARVRHSYDVSVATSARRIARVEGGFASFIDDLASRGERHESFDVMAAMWSIAHARGRAAFRAIRLQIEDAQDLERAQSFFRLDAATLRSIARASQTFGTAFETALAAGSPRPYDDEPVESAIFKLRAALAESNPWEPTRASTASGAG